MTRSLTSTGLINARSRFQYNAGAVSSPHQVTQAWGKSYQYDGNGDLASRFGNSITLTLAYDASRMTRSLTSTGAINARSRFQYGASGSRYKRIDEKGGSVTRTLRYFGSVEKETTPTRTLLRQSIGGFLLINRTVSSNTREYRYLFADALGSVDLITNETGQIIERMSFDAHGARRSNSSWVNPIQNYAPDTTLRGYTGHEMMDDLGLIHMNARIYDAELGRFLQADSMVEADATQGLNRYTYVLNNPLSSTDPSGHLSKKSLGILKSIIGIAISVWLPGAGGFLASIFGTAGSYVAAGFIAGTITGGLEGGLWGAFSAGLFYGIGTHFEKLASATKGVTNAQRAAKVVTHAVAGGTLNVLQGGKFGHGFISAGVVEAVSPTVMKIPNSYAKVAVSALVGGSVSAATGGKFGNGAITGAFQMAFNELATGQSLENSEAESELGIPFGVEKGDGIMASNFEDSYDLSGLKRGERAYDSQFKHFNDPETYDVIGHGSGTTRMSFNGRTINATRLATFITADPSFIDQPRPVNLHVCNAGRGPNPLARQLANMLGVPVSGPTRLGLITKQGNYRPQPPGVQKWFVPYSWIRGY